MITRRRSQRGQTTVEFAVLLPVIFLFLIGIFQVGITYFNQEAIQTAARDGARAASIHGGVPWLVMKQDAIDAVLANAPGLDTSQIAPTVTCSTTTCDSGAIVTVKVTYPWDLGIYDFSTSGTLSTTTQLLVE